MFAIIAGRLSVAILRFVVALICLFVGLGLMYHQFMLCGLLFVFACWCWLGGWDRERDFSGQSWGPVGGAILAMLLALFLLS